MTTAFGERLDELAAFRTTGLELRHPATPAPIAPTDESRRPMVRLALVASVAVAVVLGGWWLARDENTVVDLAGELMSEPVPALLLEEPTPLAELDPRLRESFEDRTTITPFRRLDPNAIPVEFDGVHVVTKGDTTVAVGLDTTGSVLCVATTSEADGTVGSGCGTPAQFMAERANAATMTGPTGDVTVVLVPDGVVAVEVGSATADVERNIAILDGGLNDVLRLRRDDGSLEAALSIPDPSVVGELSLNGSNPLDLAAVGCSVVDDAVVAEAAFVGTDGFVSAVVTSTGVFLTGGLGETQLDVADAAATIETTQVDGMLVLTASWEGSTPGSMRIECGDRLIDLSDIR